jgi:hypothetical protein
MVVVLAEREVYIFVSLHVFMYYYDVTPLSGNCSMVLTAGRRRPNFYLVTTVSSEEKQPGEPSFPGYEAVG